MRASRHFLHQRLTALALLPLVIWFGFAVAKLPGASHADVLGWLQSPINAALLALTLAVGLYHGTLGVQVVIEDYVSPGRLQNGLLVLLKFIWLVLISAGLFLIARILQMSP